MNTKYKKELLSPIVENSKSWTQVLNKLGLKTTGGNHRHISTIVKYYGLDTTHFTYKKAITYTKEQLKKIVEKSKSWAQVLIYLDLNFSGNNNKKIRRLVVNYGIDYSHFTGSSWNKGLTQQDHPSIKRAAIKASIPDDEVFILNGHPLGSKNISKRLLNYHNYEYICAICGLSDWQNEPITLDLDHINGNNRDNRFSNLRFLCPNCHRQTPTWGSNKR